MIESYHSEFRRYHGYIVAILEQIDDNVLNQIPVEGGNSIAMLVRHLHGNLHSRFTDLLTSDGEKEWRNREDEFAKVTLTVDDARSLWNDAWAILESALQSLEGQDLEQEITIRRQPLTVRAALLRSLAHISYHVGQMVVAARVGKADAWEFMTIPPGQTALYNQNPTKERG
jgi:uncharacterized damage-inducible protein DinB